MKTIIGILIVLVLALATSTMLLWHRAAVQERSIDAYRSRITVLERDIGLCQRFLAGRGRDRGKQQAEHDFANGTPKWYQTGGWGGIVPADKPGRQLAITGCMVSEYEEGFVDSYNKRMDELFAEN